MISSLAKFRLSTTALILVLSSGLNLFGKNADATKFIGMKLEHPSGAVGIFMGAFGKSGKFRVKFHPSVAGALKRGHPLVMRFRKYVFARDRKALAQV